MRSLTLIGLSLLLAAATQPTAHALESTTPTLSLIPNPDIDPGDESNIEEQTYEADIPQKMSLLPVDRQLRNAEQSAKQRLKKATGLELALESTTIYQITSGSRPANHAIENTTTLSGIWSPWKSPTGNDSLGLGFAGETRNNFSGSSFTEMTQDLGTLWSPNDATSDDYTTITQLWFGGRLFDQKLIFVAGKIDPGAYFNGNRFAGNGNTQFFSQPFATNPARVFPANGIGGAVRFAPVKWFYVQGEMSDSDAVNTHSPFPTVDGNWLYAGEAAFRPSIPNLGDGNYRLLLYTRNTEPQQTSGWAISFDQQIATHLGLFLRYGNNEGRVASVKDIASTGISFLRPFNRNDDEAGIGISCTHPSNNSFRDEYSSEAYYRIQLTSFVELSASAQAVYHPATTNEDLIGIFGLRIRFLF